MELLRVLRGETLGRSKLGRMFFVGFSMFTARPRELPHANLNVDSQSAPAEAKLNADSARRRTAAQSMPTKRKTGTVAKSRVQLQ